MSIINQASPSTQDAPVLGVAYLIGRLDRVLKQLIGEAVAPLGITVQQYTALSVIRARGRLSNAQLAKRSMITPQATSEVIKVLDQQGWIARQTDATNARIALISLTGAGAALLARCDGEVAKIEATLLDPLDMQSQLALRDTLKACLYALNARLNEL